jgi:hypothetical protein
MDQHRFPYANTCEDLFFKWSEYKKNNPLSVEPLDKKKRTNR